MAVLTTLTERSLSGELCTLIITVSFPFPNERYQLKIPDTVIDNFVDQIVFDHGAFI